MRYHPRGSEDDVMEWVESAGEADVTVKYDYNEWRFTGAVASQLEQTSLGPRFEGWFESVEKR